MFNLEIGQELEFIEPTNADGVEIKKGTRVRVAAFVKEVVESKVTLVLLGKPTPEVLTVDRHVVTMHCRPLQKSV
jgi:hypothetical protein